VVDERPNFGLQKEIEFKMSGEEKAQEIIRDLAKNASLIREKVKEGKLEESVRLTGQRVALIEVLRELKDAKVSLANSDVKDEMALIMKNIENDVSEAAGSINARLSVLMKELATMKGARKIAAYAVMRHPVPTHDYSGRDISHFNNERDKIQGGRYGH
jgi:hypothetical protein